MTTKEDLKGETLKKTQKGKKMKIDMFYFAATTWLRISTLIKFSHSSNQTVLQSLSKYYS
jgi:hypothetical protein